MVEYYRAWLHTRLGEVDAARRAYLAAAVACPDYCFPARLEEIAILQAANTANPDDARALFYLGNLLYDRRRHREAITCWENSVRLEPANAIAWRNLGIAYFNVLGQHAESRRAYEEAFRVQPGDARLFSSVINCGSGPGCRLPNALANSRPILTWCAPATISRLNYVLFTIKQANRPKHSLSSRTANSSHGRVAKARYSRQHVRTHLLLGRAALASGNVAEARRLFTVAQAAPRNLCEAKHLLANQSEIHFWLGEACAAGGDTVSAQKHWIAAATFKGDFQEMSVRLFSEITYYSALSWARLGEKSRGEQLFRDLLAYADELALTPARIDYFATSLPTMLLFEEDLQARQLITAKFLKAQALLGLG